MPVQMAVVAGLRERSTSIRIAADIASTYDAIVNSFGASVVSYWKFQGTGTDEKSVQNATITGNPETGIETIVDLDLIAEGAPANGTCIAWPGTSAEYAEAAHNSSHKTAAGTIVVTFQRDSALQKGGLLSFDANGAAGGGWIGIAADGSVDCYLRNSSGVPISLIGQSGDVALNQAYTLIFKWGTGGLQATLYNASGTNVRRLTNAATDGLAGTSPIRFGAWHTAGSEFDGPYGRVVWMNARITDAQETTIARARTITHTGGGGGVGEVNVGTLQVFQTQSIDVTALTGWPATRLPSSITAQGAHCHGLIRRAWKPNNNNGRFVDFCTGWQKTTASETITCQLDDASTINLRYTVGHTIPSPGAGGTTRTLDRSASPSGTTYNTWDSAITALTTNDVLVVRAPTGTWNDSGGHPIPNYVYDVTAKVNAPASVTGVTIVAHPDDVAAGRRPIIWRNAGRYARFKYDAANSWQVHASLGGADGTVYESTETSTQPTYSYFGAYRDQIGDWIGLYICQSIGDATDRSGVMHDTTYARYTGGTHGNATTTYLGPSLLYNKTSSRFEVRLTVPQQGTYQNPAAGAPWPPWDWSKHYPASNDARNMEIVITDGHDWNNRTFLLNITGLSGWKFYNLDFVYGNIGITMPNVTTQPQFYGCSFLGGAGTQQDNITTGNFVTAAAGVDTYATNVNPTTDMIFDRCSIHGSMQPWTSFEEGKGYEGVPGMSVRRDFTTWNRAKNVFRYCQILNWWQFSWSGDGSDPFKWHFHHCYMRGMGMDSALIMEGGVTCDYNVNRCFIPSGMMYGFSIVQSATARMYFTFNVDLRLNTLMCGIPNNAKWVYITASANVPCLVHSQSTGHGGRSDYHESRFFNTCVGSNNTNAVEAVNSTQGCGCGIGTDTRGDTNRIFNCIGALYPGPFAWPNGKSSFVGLYSTKNGNSQYDYNLLFKATGIPAPGTGANTFMMTTTAAGTGANTTNYADIAAFRSGTGFETNGAQADPQFAVTPTWASSDPYAAGGTFSMTNYRLGASSPARTGGRNLNDQSFPDYDFETQYTFAGGSNCLFRGALDPNVPILEAEVGIVGPAPPAIV